MKTGGHFVPCNIGSCQEHNERTQSYLDGVRASGRNLYFFPNLTGHNEHWVNPAYSGKNLQTIFDEMKVLYTEKTGQPPQLKDRIRKNKKTGRETTIAGWSPIREAVIPIKPTTKKEDFAKILQWMRDKGVEVIRLDLHHDEGHKDEISGEMKMNHHAHLVGDFLNHDTGRTVKLTTKDMSEFQTILADALDMERGVSKSITGKEHLDTEQWREKKAAEHTKELIEQKKALDEDIRILDEQKRQKNQALKDGLTAKVLNYFGSGELAEAKKDLEEANEKIQSLTTQNKNLRRDNKALKGEISRLRSEIATNEEKHVQDLKDAEKAKNEAVEEAKRYERFSMDYDNKKVRERCENQLKEKDDILRETEEERILLLDKMKDAGLIGKGDYHEMTTPPHERVWVPDFIMPKTEQHQEQNHIEETKPSIHFDDKGKQLLQQVVEYAIAWLTYGTKFGWLKDAFKDLCRHLGASTREQRNEVANIVGNEVGYIKDAKEKLTPTLSAIDPNERNNGLNRRF